MPLNVCSQCRKYLPPPPFGTNLRNLYGNYNLSNEWNPPENAVYVPLDYETIDRSVTYKWFLKLSAQDIISPESKFLWATLSQNIRH